MKKVVLVIITLLLVTGCSLNKSHNNSKVNNKEFVVQEQTIGNLKFSDVSLIYEKGISTFKVTITNLGDNISPNLNVIFKNENDTIITTLDGTFGEIEKNSFIALTLTSDVDLSNAYKVEYEVK